MIRFREFGWQFAGVLSPALRDVSLHIQRGEFVAVTGPSGSGKTTLALAMCGLLIGRDAGTVRGSVEVDGRDVADTPLHSIAETIGLVQQNPQTHFATLNVGDEIAFGMENRCLPRDEILRAGDEAMRLLSIGHLGSRSLGTLSGGEQQRVAVASIVAGRPAALVLDEPTASLDPEASRGLFAALADLCRQVGFTVVIVEHKLTQLLPHKPRLIRLEAGRVVMDSPAGEHADQPSVSSEPAAARVRTGGDVIAEMSHVTVELGGGTILDDVSMQVRAGEVVAVLGPNGGGKSTLLQCLVGLIPRAHGTIQVCGATVTPSAVSRLARQVGLVVQNADHQLVAESVWDEALFAVRNLKLAAGTGVEQAARLLDQAGLSERKKDHPYRLSWGQKRRLNVISALLHGPRLLLLDEPFAGQDWENVVFLLEAIGGVLDGAAGGSTEGCASHAGGACLVVTHDPRIVQRSCTRVLFVSGGRVTVDAPVPGAFDRLRELGHEAYVPA